MFKFILYNYLAGNSIIVSAALHRFSLHKFSFRISSGSVILPMSRHDAKYNVVYTDHLIRKTHIPSCDTTSIILKSDKARVMGTRLAWFVEKPRTSGLPCSDEVDNRAVHVTVMRSDSNIRRSELQRTRLHSKSSERGLVRITAVVSNLSAPCTFFFTYQTVVPPFKTVSSPIHTTRKYGKYVRVR